MREVNCHLYKKNWGYETKAGKNDAVKGNAIEKDHHRIRWKVIERVAM